MQPKIQRPPTAPLATTAWWLTVVLLAARVIAIAVQPGMFFDGVIYATIARNMGAGDGTFWDPHLEPMTSDALPTGQPGHWHDAPPLGIWLESLLFRVAGDHFWVEKVFSILTCLATALLIAAIWRAIVDRRSALIEYDWLPVALWACVPSLPMVYTSNFLETTLGMFAAASVYFSLRAMAAERWSLAWIAAAALALLGAALSKGPTGMFPLITPLVAGMTIQRSEFSQIPLQQQLRKSIGMTAALATAYAISLGLVSLQPEARHYLLTYLHVQVSESLAGHREVVVSRMGHFYILSHIAHQITIPTLIATGLVAFFNRRKIANFRCSKIPAARKEGIDSTGPDAGLGAVVAFSLITAASASLPLTISPKQWGHYAIPSFVYFALALAGWCAPAVAAMLRDVSAAISRRQRLLRPLAAAAIVLVCLARADRPNRQAGTYRDALALRRLVPQGSVIGIGPEMITDHWLECDLLRWSDMRFDASATTHEYRLTLGGNAAPPNGYTPVAADLQWYRLYRSNAATAVAQRRGEPNSRD